MNQKIGLLLIRVSVVLFLLPWIAAKFLAPEATANVFATYYFFEDLPELGSYILGGLQALLVLLFLLGLVKTISYGGVMLMHGVSTLSTWQQLLTPAQDPNILFWAAVPTLAALIALFLMRKDDTLLSLGGRD